MHAPTPHATAGGGFALPPPPPRWARAWSAAPPGGDALPPVTHALLLGRVSPDGRLSPGEEARGKLSAAAQGMLLLRAAAQGMLLLR
eukprot:137842-Chlamydomonas_euryale.AAC.1